MNKIKKTTMNIIVLLTIFMSNIVYADSGLESTYKEDGMIGALIEAFLNLSSLILKLITTKPGEEDYNTCHIITCIICIILIYTFTNIYIFKIDKRKKKVKQTIKILLISLIPIIIFSIICLLTKLQLIIYLLISTLYIIIFIIIINKIIKNKIKKQLIEIKNTDKKFNEEDFNKEAFEVYKKVQLSWSDFKLNDVKDIIGNQLFETYEKKLEELKNKNQKNIMEEIEYKSNNIVYIKVENNIEEIICEMNVICNDYITEEDKVIKGEKDKKYNYSYRLFFNKNLKDNKLILENKKLLKTKITKKVSKIA